jgi:hypothetical protein
MEGQKSLQSPRRVGGSPYREEGGVKPPPPAKISTEDSLTVEKNESFSLLAFDCGTLVVLFVSKNVFNLTKK